MANGYHMAGRGNYAETAAPATVGSEVYVHMGLLDSIVDQCFRDEKGGRVVIFAGGPRDRGYVVQSESEELRIRSFLKMFYFSQLSIVVLGVSLAAAWSLGRLTRDLASSEIIFLVIYGVAVVIPYLLLWRTYKKALLGVVSVQNEVLVPRKNAQRQVWIVTASLGGVLLIAIILIGLMIYLNRVK
jgi:hypothetical protein